MIPGDSSALKRYQIHKKYLSKITKLVAFIYVFIIPFISTPYWCQNLNSKNDTLVQDGIIYDCFETNHPQYYYGAKGASIINLNPLITGSLDLMCIAYLAFRSWYKTTWSI